MGINYLLARYFDSVIAGTRYECSRYRHSKIADIHVEVIIILGRELC